MIHKENCACVNCKAKGKPINEIFIANVITKDLLEIELFDWLEGFGQIVSLAEQQYIRNYGFLLIKLQKQYEDYKKKQNDSQWDATDAAHPAWWRGEKYSAYMAAKLIAQILSGEDKGKEAMNEPLATMRHSVLKLKVDRDYLKIKKDKLQKENENCWERIHYLEEENGRYWEQIGEYEKQIEILKDAVKNLNAKIITLQNRSNG